MLNFVCKIYAKNHVLIDNPGCTIFENRRCTVREKNRISSTDGIVCLIEGKSYRPFFGFESYSRVLQTALPEYEYTAVLTTIKLYPIRCVCHIRSADTIV